MTTIHELLADYTRIAPDTRAKGLYFERLIREFISTDPVYSALYAGVWLWQDWPGREGQPDTGIDLVAAEKFTGGLCAIQCKFYAPDSSLQKGDIDSFFTASGKNPFTSRLIVSTTNRWSKHALAALENQQLPTARLGINELEQSGVDWSKYRFTDPTTLKRAEPKELRTHQIEALNNVVDGFDDHDRGRLVMACGTGKTLTSLRIAERTVQPGGSVLFLVPSIALLAQTLREWTTDSDRPLRAFAICSDTKVGKSREDLTVTDLSYPATTSPAALVSQTEAGHNGEGLTVYFSTYQSIAVLSAAQKAGLPEFDLVVCDEAHRTTGRLGADESHFVRVHDANFIRARRRLYMTATPKIFGDSVKSKARDAAVELASMDDESRFGPELHRLGFGEAVERDLLTDYKVLVLAVSEEAVSAEFQQQFATEDYDLNLDDAARIAGIYKALGKSGVEGLAENDLAPMRRAVAFSRSIKDSQHVAELLNANRAIAAGLRNATDPLVLEAQHVDGTMNVMQRTDRLDWLKGEAPGNTTRILTNARCLSEGVDVPSLDAVIFLNSRDSQIDVVQSVGRVMRKLDGKQYGYIILPIAVPADVAPDRALGDNKKYKVVWEVLRALRAHDERFEARIEQFELNRPSNDPQVQVIGVKGFGSEQDDGQTKQLPLDFTPLGDEWREAVYAKIVQKVGEREYWENWAASVADVAVAQTERIRGLVATSDDAGAAFARFVHGLRDNLNPGITDGDAMEMLAQHLITQPVLEALFEGFGFANHNPVARVMQQMLDSLHGAHLDTETSGLQSFYSNVRTRIKGITDDKGKQDFLKLLYQRFFSVAMKKASERFGIVYTPTEIVDFILRSADEVSRQEFGQSLGDPGVHVLDPFTGTGTFLVRLLQLGLIPDAHLPYKYREELHANEISLLAYYVAAVNIEEAYHSRMGRNYVPFPGILLTDTFQMTEDSDELDGEGVFPENNAAVMRQKALPISVIVGNPPYSVGQGSANDENQNLGYPTLDRRIASTYAARSTAGLKRNLYDSYVRSIRWASDRVGHKGVVGLVTNGSFIDSTSFDGFRKELLDEHTKVYVYNLRGNQRTAGDLSRREGGKVFGSGSRATIAVIILVKDSDASSPGSLYYRDVGDYLSREQKLERLSGQTVSTTYWTDVVPTSEGDWLSTRSTIFQASAPITGREEGITPVFTRGINGLVTGRDAWVTNFSRSRLEISMRTTIADFEKATETIASGGGEEAVNDPQKISWTRGLRMRAARGRHTEFDPRSIVNYSYRPFTRQALYLDRAWNEMVSLNDRLFSPSIDNRGIFVVGPGESSEFAVVVTDQVADLHLIGSGQLIPRYILDGSDDPNELTGFSSKPATSVTDNLTDEILADYRQTFGDDVMKDDIFDYVYGLLHSPDYRKRFAADLKKMLPRIPKVRDFTAFRDAGRELVKLHLNYESVARHPDLVIEEPDGASLLVTKMRWAGSRPNLDKSTIVYNSDITIRGIPDEAHEYKLGSRSALDWILERYRVKKDKASGIVNDANDWGLEHGNPRYILDLIGSIVTISVETVRIVKALPPLRIVDSRAEHAEFPQEEESLVQTPSTSSRPTWIE